MRRQHCPDIVVGWMRAVEVGGGEEKRLGGSYSESFLNEGSEQYRPLRGCCTSARIRTKSGRLAVFFCRGGKDFLDCVCRIAAAGGHLSTPI